MESITSVSVAVSVCVCVYRSLSVMSDDDTWKRWNNARQLFTACDNENNNELYNTTRLGKQLVLAGHTITIVKKMQPA